MKASRLIVFVLFMAAAPLSAREKVDTLVLTNGDRLTCEIKGLDKGVLYIGLDYAQGTVQVDWSKIRQINSKQLFLINTEDGRSVVGTLSMEETDRSRVLRIEPVEESAAPVLIKQREVVGINETSQNVWQRFSGAVNSGFTYSKANDTMQYSLGATTEYLRQRWSSEARFSSTLTGNTGVPTSTRNNVMINYRHLMSHENWFYTAVGTILQSTEQKIQVQNDIGGGIGRYVLNTNHATINLFSGLLYQNTRYTQTVERPPSQNTAAVMVGVNAGLFQFDKTKVTMDAIAIPALNQPGRIYNTVGATYYVKLWGKLTWNLSFDGNWDNQPPAHFSGSDYGVTSGLGWTFGNYNSANK